MLIEQKELNADVMNLKDGTKKISWDRKSVV